VTSEGPVPTSEENTAAEVRAMLSDLAELIAAIDRRVPRLERIGEAQIAQDAADLRERALNLIQRIERNTPKDSVVRP
jgi:type VI protein secretion system component VasF